MKTSKRTLALLPTVTEEKFNALPASTRRTLLAEDVIRYVAARKLFIDRGIYMNGDDQSPPPETDLSTSTDAGKACVLDRECYVCAKGALFVASVLRTNHCTVSDVLAAGCHTMRKRMVSTERVFSARTYDLIEVAFEGSTFTGELRDRKQTFSDEDGMSAVEFSENCYESDEEYEDECTRLLLVSIMVNIIRNNGEFIPKNKVTVADARKAMRAATPKRVRKQS